MTGAPEVNKEPATGGDAKPSSKSGKGGKAGWILAGPLGIALIAAGAGCWYFYDQGEKKQTALDGVLEQVSVRARTVASDRNASPAEIAFLGELGTSASDHSAASRESARAMFALAKLLRTGEQTADSERLMAAGSKLYSSLGIANGELAGRYWTEWADGIRTGQERIAAKDRDTARTAYVAAADASAKLVAVDPGNIDFQRAHIDASMEAGDALFVAQDTTAAKTRFEAALSALDVIRTEPESVDALRKKASALGRLGDIAEKADNNQEALTHFASALGHAEAVVKADPNVRSQRDVWTLLIKSGDQSAATGNQMEARAKYERAASIAAAISAEPSGERYRRDTLTTQVKLGDLARTANDAEGAKAAYQKALQIGRLILAAEPTDIRTTRSVILMQYRLGDIARDARDKASAHRLYADGIATATVAAAAAPDNTQLQGDLASGKTRQERLARQK